MDTRPLGRTGLSVSQICLGTMTWGEQNSEADAHTQLDYALDRGVNFIDAAELYPIPPKANTRGRTEAYIGSWLKARQNRDKVILATKVVGRTSMEWFRKDGSLGEISRAQVNEAVDRSLTALNTDYIDLYQIHWPDRQVSQFGANPVIYQDPEQDNHPNAREGYPIAQQLEIFSDLVKQGKIRHFGLSNESSWGVMQFTQAAKPHDLPPVTSLQNAYSLVNRTFETNLAEACTLEGISLLAYSPLAQGYLTGKYENGALPKASRKALFDRLQRYEKPGAASAFSAYVELARKLGLNPAQLALKFVLSRPFTTSAIIGATTMAQLETNIASPALEWTDELEDKVNAIHLLHTNPCP